MKPSERIDEIFTSKLPKNESLGVNTQSRLIDESIIQFLDEFHAQLENVLTSICDDMKNPKLK